MNMKITKLLTLSLMPVLAIANASFAAGQAVTDRDMAIENIYDDKATVSKAGGAVTQAKPYVNPLIKPDTSSVSPLFGNNAAGVAGVMGDNQVTAKSGDITGRAFGSFGVPYTSARVSHKPTTVVAHSTANYLSATYPYSAIGKLTFTNPSSGLMHQCSASLIRSGVIVTAAHCIQNFGSGNNTFTNFRFTPATYNGSVPYGTWDIGSYVRPASWANGTDVGTGAARDNDLAVLIVKKNTSNQFIKDVVGGALAYGWNNYSFVSSSRTGNLSTAAISTLGYPALLDSGRIMQRTDGPAYLTTLSGAGQIYSGSDLTGGSSGGPWIANFGYQDPARGTGAVAGTAALRNVVVGVTSWGSADPNTPKDNYASQFRQNTRYPNLTYGTYGAGNIGSLLQTLCTAKPSGSTKTYAQLGYCS
ncbi:MAG: trypsin-like serine protease [Candidatus Thiothrix putei]|uniref:Trypsin-like serine protease n=1 Tax=Candidatus Thiothrix putei TaxID=3080811 RepID=A0AA95HFM5_9GAMM|nr:MAG: trypsin-like serine protease [Candidatus Thiothrix putei]